MKALGLLTATGVAALAATIIDLNAGESLLSPRAKDSQIQTAPARPGNLNLALENRAFVGSLRALDQQNAVVKGRMDTPNLTAKRCAVIGSPRQAESPTVSCCTTVRASCTTSAACSAQK